MVKFLSPVKLCIVGLQKKMLFHEWYINISVPIRKLLLERADTWFVYSSNTPNKATKKKYKNKILHDEELCDV